MVVARRHYGKSSGKNCFFSNLRKGRSSVKVRLKAHRARLQDSYKECIPTDNDAFLRQYGMRLRHQECLFSPVGEEVASR